MAAADVETLLRTPGSPYRAMMPVFPARLRELEAQPRDVFTRAPAPTPAVEPEAVIPLVELSGFHGYLDPFVSRDDSKKDMVGGAARLSTAITQECERNPQTLLLSGGDFFQGPPISTQFDGRPVVECMNYDEYDTMTLGNHDFDRGVDLLAARLREGRFTPLGANLREKASNRPIWETSHPLSMVRPYRMLDSGDRRVAVVGLLKPETAELTGAHNCDGLTFGDIPDTLRQLLPDLVRKEHPDAIVLHCQQIHQSRDILKIARQAVEGAVQGEAPPLLVFLGGHAHPDFKEPVVTEDGVIVQSTDRGAALNVTRLHVDRATRRLVSVEHEYRPILKNEIDPDPDVDRILYKYHAQLDGEMNRIVGTASVDLRRSRHSDSGVGILVTEAMLEAARADVAFVTGGSLKSDIAAGPVSVGQLHETIPFENHLVVLRMTGRQLSAVLEKSASRPTGDKVLQMAGARMVYDSSRPVGQRVLSSEIGGRAIEPDREYRVAVDDFLAGGGDFFSEFEGRERIYSDGPRVKDLLRDWFLAHHDASFRPDRRISEAS